MIQENDSEQQVYHPNAQDSGPGGGAACFIDQYRPCGVDCMAYSAQVPEGEHYKGEQWAHCMVLTNLDRLGRHTVILTSSIVRKARQEAGESIRSQKPPGVI